MLTVTPPQTQSSGNLRDLSGRALNFNKPSGIRNVIQTNGTTIEPVFFANFGVGFLNSKLKELQDSFGRGIFHRSLDFHPNLLPLLLTRTFEGQHRDFSAVTAQAQFQVLAPQPIIAVE